MGLFDKLFGKGKTRETGASGSVAKEKDAAQKTPEVQAAASQSGQGSRAAIDRLLLMAEVAVEDEDYETAARTYRDILELEPDKTAQYNLGSLYAQGKGVGQDFMEGAYWFHQAELAGDERAGKLCQRCMLDFTHQNFDTKTPEQLYIDMTRFVGHVYPDTKDVRSEVCRKLYAIAGNHFNSEEYAAAAKLFRAAAEFGNDGYSQNYLAVLYNAGAGLQKNDLASLYWFDKAVDNGAADVAQKDRDGMLNAYRTNFKPEEFYEEMLQLSGWCSVGSRDVPKDAAKSAYWREVGESRIKETSGN